MEAANREVESEQTVLTREDIVHRKKFPVIVPIEFLAVINLLTVYILFCTILVTAECGHVVLVNQIRTVLRNQSRMRVIYKPRDYVALIWAIHCDARQFFSARVTPVSDLSLTLIHLKRRTILAENSCPLGLFLKTASGYAPPPEEPSGGPGGGSGPIEPPPKVQRTAAPPAACGKLKAEHRIDALRAAGDALLAINKKVNVRFLLSKGVKLSAFRVGTQQCMDYHIFGECRNPTCTMRATACAPTPPRMEKVLASLTEAKATVAPP